MKIISATAETPGMTNEEVDMFLEKRFMLQISTLDEKGEPNIQPVWFYYDKSRDKLLVTISKIDPSRTVPEGDRISMKYLNTLDHPIAKMRTDHSKRGETVLIEIDYSKPKL